MKNIICILLALACVAGCKPAPNESFDAPEDIRRRALEFARLYAEAGTEYFWGGQDPLRLIQMDCSGLVVMCYNYALVDTGYELPFDDATAAAMHDDFSLPTDSPLPGDLIFMGSADSTAISHISLFKEATDGRIYFVDATKKNAEGDYPAVDGVSERSYPENDPRFKSFGILQIINSG